MRFELELDCKMYIYRVTMMLLEIDDGCLMVVWLVDLIDLLIVYRC